MILSQSSPDRLALLLSGYASFTVGVLTLANALRHRQDNDVRLLLDDAQRLEEPDQEPADLELYARAPRRGRFLRARALRRALADGETWAVLEAAVGGARVDVEAGERPYAVVIGRRGVTVCRTGSAAVTRQPSHAAPDTTLDAYLALGSTTGGVILIDLEAAPGVVSVTGDPDAAGMLFAALVAQVGSMPRRRLLVAASALPDAPATTLADLLAGLARAEARQAAGPAVLLACARPSGAEAVEIQRAVARDRRLTVLVLGTIGGSRWSLVVDEVGRVTVPGLGIEADTAGLSDIATERPAPAAPVTAPRIQPPPQPAWEPVPAPQWSALGPASMPAPAATAAFGQSGARPVQRAVAVPARAPRPDPVPAPAPPPVPQPQPQPVAATRPAPPLVPHPVPATAPAPPLVPATMPALLPAPHRVPISAPVPQTGPSTALQPWSAEPKAAPMHPGLGPLAARDPELDGDPFAKSQHVPGVAAGPQDAVRDRDSQEAQRP